MSKTSRTLADGLAVLRLLHDTEAPLTSGDVARMLNMERTKAYRLLNTLREHGFAGRLESGAFVPTSLVGMLGAGRYSAIGEAAEPVLSTLAARTGMTSHVSVAEGDVVTAVKVVVPMNTNVHLAYREGSNHEISKGAAGVVILARRASRGAATLEPRLQEILDAGYALTRGELQSGAVGLAAALDLDTIDASVGLVTLDEGHLDLDAVSAQLLDAKGALDRRLASVL